MSKKAVSTTKFLMRAKLIAHLANSIFNRVKGSKTMMAEIKVAEKFNPAEVEDLLDYSLSVAVTFADFIDNIEDSKNEL